MTSNRTEGPSVPFSEATKVEKLDSHTYRVHLHEAFSIGAVPNGGYTASCMLAAANTHLFSRGQPDTLTAHFQYSDRVAAGPGIVVIHDVKLSRQLSTLHLTLYQDGLLPHAPWTTPSVSRPVVLAYTTHTDLGSFNGITLPTGYEVTPAAELPSPMPDFDALKIKGADDAWEKATLPPSSAALMHSLRNWHFYVPRAGPLTPGVLDMWIRFASGEEHITQGALAYVVDSFPYNLHTFLAAPELRKLLLEPLPLPAQDKEGSARAEEVREKDKQRAGLWLPTVAMSLESKTALPEEGVEWLAVCVTSKQIKDGKFDLEVLVRDADGEMVALSHHVALILSMERNTRKRARSAKAAL